MVRTDINLSPRETVWNRELLLSVVERYKNEKQY